MKRRVVRARQRGVTPVEAAVSFAVVGSVLAVSVPAFFRELSASRFVEPVNGVQKIGELAVAYAHDRQPAQAFPPSAPLTPPAVPRGTREVDPPGAWDQPTWKELGFRPVADGVPHAFACGFDSASRAASASVNGGPSLSAVPAQSTFVAHAHGDLDGDGITSTFEVRGHDEGGEGGAVIEPGMYVEAEVE